MAGLKPNTLKSLAEKGIKLYSCVDNDEAGIKFTATNNLTPCRKVLEENGVKDYNELLQKISRNLTRAEHKTTQTAPPSPRNPSHSRRWFLKIFYKMHRKKFSIPKRKNEKGVLGALPLSWQKTSPQKSFARIFKKIFRKSKNIFFENSEIFSKYEKKFCEVFWFFWKNFPESESANEKIFSRKSTGFGVSPTKWHILEKRSFAKIAIE